jgi:hypothetical protein
LPLDIEVSQAALPGTYYVRITFASGPNLNEAEAAAAADLLPTVLVNLTIRDQSVEKAQLVSFTSARNIYTRLPVEFNAVVKNTGNVPLSPAGVVYLYNRRQQEVASLRIESTEPIPPDGTAEYPLRWNTLGTLGKYKARLELGYGSAGTRELQDTIYLWLLPLPFLIGFGAVVAVIIGLASYVLLKRTRAIQKMTAVHHREQSSGVINLRDE